MRIYVIDDEPLILESMRRIVREAEPEEEPRCFSRVPDLLEALGAEPAPDVVFCDIEMPGMSGLDLAVRIKTLSPDTRIVFVTGYSQYAVEAYRMHAEGYVLKPVTAERVREELALVRGRTPAEDAPDRLQVRCFGSFEVFWKGEPLSFARRKTKELLAYLVDRRGEMCTGGEIVTALWEGEGELRKRKTYLRTLTADLRSVLSEIGMEDVLIRDHQQWAVRPELLDCDYYRMLDGDMEAVNSFRGEYMSRYGWAELTSAKLYFREN